MEINDFSFLSSSAREILVRMHRNRAWQFPTGLIQGAQEEGPEFQELLFWDEKRGAVQLFFSDPIVRQKPESRLSRYSQCIRHLVRLLAATTPVKDIWTPELRKYYATRIAEGAAPNTVGWELSTLSVIYGILGHSDKEGYLDEALSVNRRYGAISNKELIEATDQYTVDHGESEIDARPMNLNPVSRVLPYGKPVEDFDEHLELLP